ncbi:EamA family transporter [Desulfitobacterium sp. THU1]|uniref:DMT family transporter n=1 Tax=Desulfitobacterium sp. THU1 TaxID=3138072 RepID=UPI00311ECE08
MLNGYFLIITTAIGYAALPIFIKWGYNQGLTMDDMLFSRFFIASIFMVLILSFSKKKGFKVSKASLVPIAFQGLLFFGSSYAYFLSIKHMSASITNILLYTYPLMVVLMSTLIYKEKLSLVKGVTLLIAFFGCLLVIDIVNLSGSKMSMWGFFYGIASALFYALYNIVGQYVSEKADPFTVATFITMICLVATSVIYPPTNILSGDIQMSLWIVGLGMAILCTVIPLFCYQKGLSLLGASRASLLSNIEPAITTVLAGFILGETLTVSQLFGGMLIIGGVLLLKFDKLDEPYLLKHHLSDKA